MKLQMLISLKTKLSRYLVSVPVLLTLLVVNAQAQAPPPSNPLAIDEYIRKATLAAQLLLNALQNELIGRLSPWVYGLAVGVSVLVMMFAFLRVWRENGLSGESVPIFAFWIRATFCLFFMASAPAIVANMASVGKWIVEGEENGVLINFYLAQRQSFNAAYDEMAYCLFTVRAGNETITIRSRDLQGNPIMGVLVDKEGAVKDLDKKLQDSSWSMPALFRWLTSARLILEGGNFWLAILGGVLLMIFKFASPLMVAVAIDQKIAHKITYPFLWGAVVLTLIWPAVRYFIAGVAYMFANAALLMTDIQPLYVWDTQTMRAISLAPSSLAPQIVFVCCFVMTIAGLCLWVSPYLAYRFSMGQLYEGVSAMVSQFGAMIIGTGVEMYSATAAAGLNQAASNTQTVGHYNADVTRAKGELDASNLGTRARQIQSTAGVRGTQVAQTAGIYGALTNQLAGINAMKQLGINSAAATAALSKAGNNIGTDKSILELQAGKIQQSSNIEANRAADTQNFEGTKVQAGADWLSKKFSDKGSSKTGGAIEIGGGAYGLQQQYSAIQMRAEMQQGALEGATQLRTTIQENTRDRSNVAQDQYLNSMTQAQEKAAGEQSAGARAGAAQAAGGVNRGAAIQISGINQAAELEKQGNQTRNDAANEAARITKTADIEASVMRAKADIMSRIGSKIASDIEKAMQLHY